MALYESYAGSEDSNVGSTSTTWWAQTFTPAASHDITKVVLKLSKTGTPGTVTVSIRATTADKPSGGDLCVGTINGNDLSASFVNTDIVMGTNPTLSSGIKYAIVIRAAGSTVHWSIDNTSPGYADGATVRSFDSGAAWTIFTTQDAAFEEHGNAAGGGSGGGGLQMKTL